MKLQYIFAFLFLMFASTLLQAQFEIEWVKQFGGNFTESANNLIVTKDNNFLVTGYSKSDDLSSIVNVNYAADAYILLVDSDGEKILENEYGGSDHDFIQAAIEVDDGIVFLGRTFSDDGDIDSLAGAIDIWIVKLNKEGDLLWEETFGGTGNESATGLIQAVDGGYLITGSSESSDASWANNGGSDIVLIKVSAEGELEWTSSYGEAGDELGTKLIQDVNGDIFIATVATTVGPTLLNVTEPSIQKVSSAGELLWQKNYNGRITFFKELPDGNYLLVGSSENNASLIKVDIDGNLIWQRIIGAAGVERVFDVEIAENGNIVGVGSTTSDTLGLPMSQSDVLLFELNAEGDLLWRDTCQIDSYSVASIKHTKDDGYVILSKSIGPEWDGLLNHDLILLKVFLNTSATTNLDPVSTLQLYPNPASDQIVLTVEPEDIGSAYSIHNGIGQVISKGQVSSRNQSFDIQSFPVGTYTLSLRNASGSQSRSFVKR